MRPGEANGDGDCDHWGRSFPAFLLAKKPENSVPEWSNPRPRWLSHWSISQDIHLHLSLQVPMHLHGYSHKHQYGFL